jgi:hypothetical protein
MDSPMLFLGVEIAYPFALLLIPFLAIGVWGSTKRGLITKSWEGSARPTLSTRLRVMLPSVLLALGTLGIILALADVTRAYTVKSEVLAVNRFIVTLDNSSSMYNFAGGPPIHCTDRELKIEFPRIWNACRAMDQLITSTEAYAKKKGEDRQDKIAILRFGLNSFVEVHPSSDYVRLRTMMEKMNWRDPRTGIFTEIHLALWDMYQIALQRNFRGAKNNTALTDEDRLVLLRALRPDATVTQFYPPKQIEDKLIALRKDMRDTALIIISDAQEGQFEARLNKDPVSFIKMMQLAKFIELPVHVISIYNDHEFVRGLAEETGYGEAKGPDRGGFHLLRSEKDYAHMDEIIGKILATRFRPDSTREDVVRESYTSRFAFAGLLLIALGMILRYSPFGRVLTQHHGGEK